MASIINMTDVMKPDNLQTRRCWRQYGGAGRRTHYKEYKKRNETIGSARLSGPFGCVAPRVVASTRINKDYAVAVTI